MSVNYPESVVELIRLLGVVSSECKTFSAKLNSHADRLVGVNRNLNAQHAGIFDTVMRESSLDLEAYARGLRDTLPSFESNIPLVTEGFAGHINLINPKTEEGQNELGAFQKELTRILQTFNNNKSSLTTMQDIVHKLRAGDYDPRVSRASSKLIDVINKHISVYEEFITFALKIQFLVNEKRQSTEG